MTRLFSILLVTVLQIQQPTGIWSNQFVLKGEQDKALHGYSLGNFPGTTMEKCLERCLANCRCQSFQVCNGMECQLNVMNKYRKPSALLETKGCVHYYFGEDYTQVHSDQQQCGSSCSTPINCCLTSNPCKNGGTCLPSPVLNNKKRFQCKCAKRYRGPRCQLCVTGYAGFQCPDSRSCQAYKNQDRQPGTYKIFDANTNSFDVFCDFDKNSLMSWTLISSYKISFHDSLFIKWPFVKDTPKDEDHPNWNTYRLSKSRMKSIQQDSTKWRITCDYQPTTGVIYKDYVRASNDKVNILTYTGLGCVDVEYIDIRGQHCSDCTAFMVQSHNRDVYKWHTPLHFDSYYPTHRNICDFKPTGSFDCDGKGEDNFGFYDCPNPDHRCSATENSTTQIWFGGE